MAKATTTKTPITYLDVLQAVPYRSRDGEEWVVTMSTVQGSVTLVMPPAVAKALTVGMVEQATK